MPSEGKRDVAVNFYIFPQGKPGDGFSSTWTTKKGNALKDSNTYRIFATKERA
jgi:hypothetical protein